MSDARLIVEAVGPGTTLQDRGRHGFRRFGVSVSGPMDWVSHALALRLAGANGDDPVIETGPGGLILRAENAAARLGVAGLGASIEHVAANGATTRLDAPLRLVLEPGDTMRLRGGRFGVWGYVSASGLRIENGDGPVLGSWSLNPRTGLGPPPPEPGMAFRCEKTVLIEPPLPYSEPLSLDGVIDVLPGPQTHLFPSDVLEAFVSEAFALTPAVDRMGYRLEGPRLQEPGGHDIVSDGLVEGAIQVPGDGCPIVLCADRAPTGGYPKIGVVSRAALPRLVQARPGDTVRFRWTTAEGARRSTAALRAAIEGAEPLARHALDARFLLNTNLISGVWGGEVAW